jgi:hypothetical protein
MAIVSASRRTGMWTRGEPRCSLGWVECPACNREMRQAVPDNLAQLEAIPKPIPPRYWWLKRIVVGVAVLLIAFGALRWWWGIYADRAFRAELDRHRTAGEPIVPKDFVLPHVPDDRNAVVLPKQAVARWNPTPGQSKLIEEACRDPHLGATHRMEIHEVLNASAEARRLIRRASSAGGGLGFLGARLGPGCAAPETRSIRRPCQGAVRRGRGSSPRGRRS